MSPVEIAEKALRPTERHARRSGDATSGRVDDGHPGSHRASRSRPQLLALDRRRRRKQKRTRRRRECWFDRAPALTPDCRSLREGRSPGPIDRGRAPDPRRPLQRRGDWAARRSRRDHWCSIPAAVTSRLVELDTRVGLTPMVAYRITAWAAGSRNRSRRPRESRAAHKVGVRGRRVRRRSRHPAQRRQQRRSRAR